MAGTDTSASTGDCGRCRLPREDEYERSVLVLGAEEAHAQEALIKALENSRVPHSLVDDIVVVPRVRRDMAALENGFLDRLSVTARDAVRGVFLTEPPGSGTSALRAFLHAQPLTVLLERARHEWVRDVLVQQRLFSVFHPILSAADGSLFAHEALIRARSVPDDTIIGAGAILQACEKLSLQHALDQQARQTAIRGAAALNLETERIFINFLPNTIYDPEICLRTTIETARECRIDLSRLVFEVVETERIPDMSRLQAILDYYRSRGVGTAVDDMGAGFSSLQYLEALRPDFVKLDRDLMVRAVTQPEARESLRTIIGASREIGARIIAEGIETPDQFVLCREEGVDYVQGFLFARPAFPPEPIDCTPFADAP